MEKTTRHKTKMKSVVADLKAALATLEDERDYARMGRQWPTVEFLNDQIKRLSEIISSDGGQCGLEPYANNMDGK